MRRSSTVTSPVREPTGSTTSRPVPPSDSGKYRAVVVSSLDSITSTVGGKGKGLVATRRIARYSVILEEDPVLVKDPNNNQDDRELWEDFQNLTPSGFRAPGLSSDVLKLFDPQAEEDDGTEISAQNKLRRIMEFNSIKYTNKLTEKTTQNLYLRISRINHSCNPNTAWRPSITSNRCAVVALVTIEKDQELTVNYFYNLTDPRGGFCLGYHQRQQKLRNLFSFQCLCQVCQQVGPVFWSLSTLHLPGRGGGPRQGRVSRHRSTVGGDRLHSTQCPGSFD